MKPGTRVTVQGRPGVVKALRPGNSVDVQFDGESFTTRHDSSHLRPFRSNPGPRGGLTPRERESLPDSVFALPGRRFPINDANHGRIALQYILAGRVAEGDVNTVVQAVLRRWGQNREVRAFYEKHKAKLTRQNVERIHGRRVAANPAGEVYDPAKEQLRAQAQGIYETAVRKKLSVHYKTPFVDDKGVRLDSYLSEEDRRDLFHGNKKKRIYGAMQIAVGLQQKHGYLIPGTLEPTAKGIQRSAERLLDPAQREHADKNRQDYERTLAAVRKSGHFRVVAEMVDGQKRYVVQPRPTAELVRIPDYRLSEAKAREDADRAEAAFRKASSSVKGRANPYYYQERKLYVRSVDIEDEPEEGIIGEGIEVGRESYKHLADRLGVPADLLMRYGTVELEAEEDYVTDETGKRSVLPGFMESPLVRQRPPGSVGRKPVPADTIPKHMRGGVVSKAKLIANFESQFRDEKGAWRSLAVKRFDTPEARDAAKAELEKERAKSDVEAAQSRRASAEAEVARFKAAGDALRAVAVAKRADAVAKQDAILRKDKSLGFAYFESAERKRAVGEQEIAASLAAAAESAVEAHEKEATRRAAPPSLQYKGTTKIISPFPSRQREELDVYSPRRTAAPSPEQVETGKKALATLAAAAEEKRRKELEETKKQVAALPVPKERVNVDRDIVDAVYSKLQKDYGILVDEGYEVSVYLKPGRATSYAVETFLSGAVQSPRPELSSIVVKPLVELAENLQKMIELQEEEGDEGSPDAYIPALKKVQAEIERRSSSASAAARPGTALMERVLGPSLPRRHGTTAAEAAIERLEYAVPKVDRSLIVSPEQLKLLRASEKNKLVEAYKKEHNVDQVPVSKDRILSKQAEENVDKELVRRKLVRNDVKALKNALDEQMRLNKRFLVDRYVLPAIRGLAPAPALTTAAKEAGTPEKVKPKKSEVAARQYDIKQAGAVDLDIVRPFWDVESHYDEATGVASTRYVLFVPSTIAYLSKVKTELGRVQLENESAFIRGEKGVTSEDYAVEAADENAQLERLRQARADGNFIAMAEAQSALARLGQAKQARRAKQSLMTQAQERGKAERIRAAERVAMFVLPPEEEAKVVFGFGMTAQVDETTTEKNGWMEDIDFTRRARAEQQRAREKNQPLSSQLSGYTKFYTTSPLLAFYTIMLWNSPELFTGFDLGLPAPHEKDGKTYWKNISIGPVTSPRNRWHSPLYGYYETLAQLELLMGDLAHALLKDDTQRAAEDIIDIDGVTDMTSPVQRGLSDAVSKLRYRFSPISRRPVSDKEKEVNRIKAQIKEEKKSLALGTVPAAHIEDTKQYIKSLEKHLPAEHGAQLEYEKTELAKLMRSSGKGVELLVAEADAVVAAKLLPLLSKKNPQRSFR